MATLAITPNLTPGPVGALAVKTHGGMAYFAGTGPKGKSCRECSSWACKSGQYPDRYAARPKLLKPCVCLKFKSMMQGKSGPPIPYDAGACKYFEQKESPPPIILSHS